MRRTVGFVAAAILTAGLLVGCGSKESAKAAGSVAVIDLDEVLRRLGRDVEMSRQIKLLEEQLGKDLAQLQNDLKKQLEDRKKQFGAEPTSEQVQQLNQLEMQLNSRFQQAQLNTRSEWDKHRQVLAAKFREEVRPVSREVAAERGCNVVLTKDPGHVFSVDPAVDITEEVIGRLARNAPPAAGAAEMKK